MSSLSEPLYPLCWLPLACLGSWVRDLIIQPYLSAPGIPPISYLLFTDDCLLLGQATMSTARGFKAILQDYCLASGHRINFLKSEVHFSPKTFAIICRSIRDLLQIPEGQGVLRYLGVPISGARLQNRDCPAWSMLSRREWRVGKLEPSHPWGRVILIRSVLSSIPVFMLSNIVIPRSIILKVEQMIRAFLWNSSANSRGVHILEWNVVCQPISKRGLGIHYLLARHEALLARHMARICMSTGRLWSSVMRARYGLMPTFAHNMTIPSCQWSPTWREMMISADLISQHIRWIVGNGRTISNFMTDAWISDISLIHWLTFIAVDIPETIDFWSLSSGCYLLGSRFSHPDFWRCIRSASLIYYLAYPSMWGYCCLEFFYSFQGPFIWYDSLFHPVVAGLYGHRLDLVSYCSSPGLSLFMESGLALSFYEVYASS